MFEKVQLVTNCLKITDLLKHKYFGEKIVEISLVLRKNLGNRN